jgi:prepilin-type N-terminal cleavage/methylation domain-containing protein
MILTRRYMKPVDAFTLIEMMTVVAIMAVHTKVAFPGIKMAMVNAQMARSTQDARSIVMGLRSWATDNGGAFPAEETHEGDSISSSNDAFRDLVPNYIDTEAIFVVGCFNHGRSADNRIDEVDDILQPGKNHFANVAGLTDTIRSNWPLVVDGNFGQFILDTSSRKLREEGNGTVKLSPREYGLLSFFLEKRGTALSQERIMSEVWGTRRLRHEPKYRPVCDSTA